MIKKLVVAGVCVFALSPLAVFAASFFTISDAGDFGFGTDSPLHKIDVVGSIYSRLVALSDSSTIAVDWNDGNTQKVTLGGNRTFTFSNAQSGGHYTVLVKQDGTGSRTVTWPGSVEWSGGVAPTLATAASATDIFSFVYDGTSYFGHQVYSASAAYAFADNFDSYSDGDLNSANGGMGWSGAWSGSSSFDVQGSIVSDGSKAIKITQSSPNEPTIERGFTSMTTGTLHWEQRKSAVDHDQGIILFSGSTVAAQIVMAGTGRTYQGYWQMNDGGSATSTGIAYSTGTFYSVDVQFDTSTDKFRVSINGGAYTPWSSFANAVSGIDKVQLSTSASGLGSTDGYWDEIRMSD